MTTSLLVTLEWETKAAASYFEDDVRQMIEKIRQGDGENWLVSAEIFYRDNDSAGPAGEKAIDLIERAQDAVFAADWPGVLALSRELQLIAEDPDLRAEGSL